MFSWEFFFFLNSLLHFRVNTKKLLDTKVIFFLNLGSIFGGLKISFFRASCFSFIVKGVCLLLLPLVSLHTQPIMNEATYLLGNV